MPLPNMMTYNIYMDVISLEKNITCCLSGHRPKTLPWKYNEENANCIQFKKDLNCIINMALNYGFKNFLVGMAEGFDMIGAECILNFKTKNNNIKIYAIIPCKNQEIKWSLSQQKRYHKIINQCDDIIILSEKYTKNCMNLRNKYMINLSSLLIACYNGSPSGTGNTVKYAKNTNCKILLINPDNYK